MKDAQVVGPRKISYLAQVGTLHNLRCEFVRRREVSRRRFIWCYPGRRETRLHILLVVAGAACWRCASLELIT